MGTVKYNEKKKCYEVRYDAGRDGQGERIQKFKGGFKKQKEAKDYLAEQETNISKGIYIEPQKMLLCDYLTAWLKEQKPRLSPTTHSGYEVNIRCHINPGIGGVRLQELKPLHIRKLYTELQQDREFKLDGKKRKFKPLSGTSTQYVHRVLSKALEDAFKDEIIFRNPARLVTPPAREKFEAGFLAAAQIREMLDKLQGDEMYMPVMLSVSLGLRRGEVLGLQWKDIDFNNKIIRVRNNYVMAGGQAVLREATKTDSSHRDIIVTDRIMKALKAHRHGQKVMRARLKDYHKSDFVCTWQDGQPFNPSHLSRSFSLRLERLGLPRIRFHDLRHSNAALMISQGAPMKGASDRLGHSTIQITQDIYGHVERSVQEQIAESIDQAIWGK
jgi:integrase